MGRVPLWSLTPEKSARIIVSHVLVYDRALCCSTGVCGPQVDPELVRFAADLQWLESNGHQVTRWNLAQDPGEFAANTIVQEMITDQGVECLPLILVDDRVVSRNEYPKRENLALWTNTRLSKPTGLPLADGGGCSGESGCC